MLRALGLLLAVFTATAAGAQTLVAAGARTDFVLVAPTLDQTVCGLFDVDTDELVKLVSPGIAGCVAMGLPVGIVVRVKCGWRSPEGELLWGATPVWLNNARKPLVFYRAP